MADIQKRQTNKGVRCDVRYRDDANRQRKRSFARKVGAQHFANSVETDLLRGEWIDPRRGQELFGEWAGKWLTTIGDTKPKTRESYESIVNKHLLPRFAHVQLGAIDFTVVVAFVADLQGAGHGAARTRDGCRAGGRPRANHRAPARHRRHRGGAHRAYALRSAPVGCRPR